MLKTSNSTLAWPHLLPYRATSLVVMPFTDVGLATQN